MFYENRFAYKGKYFNDLSPLDRRAFMEHNISYADIHSTSQKENYQYFLKLNRGGRQMDKDHLKYVETLYEKE